MPNESPLLQQRDENPGYDTAEKIRQLREMFNNRPTLENIRLAERYVKGEFNVLICFVITGQTKHYVAILRADISESIKPNYSPFNQGWGDSELWHELANVVVTDCDPHSSDWANPGDQGAMLVHDVEVMDCPKFVVRSLVRLERFDLVADFFRQDALYFSIKDSFVFLLAFANRKADLTKNDRIGNASGNGEVISEMIPRASQVMNSIPGKCGDDGRDCSEVNQVILGLADLRVILRDRSIGIGIKKDSPCRFQITNVLFGPFNFEPNAVNV